MEEAIHAEIPGYGMIALAPTRPKAKLVVKRWAGRRWRVISYETGTYEELHKRMLEEMIVLETEYQQGRAARHVGE